jgi:hypothetical protein
MSMNWAFLRLQLFVSSAGLYKGLSKIIIYAQSSAVSITMHILIIRCSHAKAHLH